MDRKGQSIAFRLTARRDAKAAKAFLKQAIEGVRLCRPVSIRIDKAPGYRKVIGDPNHRHDPRFDGILRIDRTWRNNRTIENDHISDKAPGVRGEIGLVRNLFGEAA